MNNISTFTRIITILLYNISIRRKERKKGKNDVQSRETERERFIRGKLRISKRQDKLLLPGIRVSSAIAGCKLGKLTKKLALFLKSHLHLKRGCLGEGGESFLKRLRDRRRRGRRIRKGG